MIARSDPLRKFVAEAADDVDQIKRTHHPRERARGLLTGRAMMRALVVKPTMNDRCLRKPDDLKVFRSVSGCARGHES
jgi:hypothetical protein